MASGMKGIVLLAALPLGVAACGIVHEHRELTAEIRKLGEHGRTRMATCRSGDGKMSCACEHKCVQSGKNCECQDPP